MSWRQGCNILLCVCGGISAYKTAEVVRIYRRAGCSVETILTHGGSKFVSPLVLSTLSERQVWMDDDFLSDDTGWKIPHISLASWADAVVVAPATASALQQAATGGASGVMSATLLATRAPVLMFPAMNDHMLSHPATEANMELCRKYGYTVVSPNFGDLACGTQGRGRLPEPPQIGEWTWRNLFPDKSLHGKRVLVTAGPTWEYIDPVRFISNPSTGLMGMAMARAAWYRGADVTVVCGPGVEESLPGVRYVRVVSADQMYEVCMEEALSAHAVIKTAAVGDYKPMSMSDRKIKRENRGSLSIELQQNRDIAKALGASKGAHQVLVGFAAETDDLAKNAALKLDAKNLDLIVANDVTMEGAGFGSDSNTVRVFGRGGETGCFSGPKDAVASQIWEVITPLMI